MSNFRIQDLHTYIVKVAEKELNNSSFLDTVTTGTITASLPGYYQVSLVNGGDTTQVNALTMNDAVYNVNDYVYLLKAPSKGGDNFNNSYFIFGLATEVQERYANLTEWERFNGNLVTIETSKDLATTLKDTTLLESDNENLIQDIKLKGTFAITGYFTANKSEDFGLEVFLQNENTVLESFKLDKNYFTGQVSKLKGAYQKRICQITKDSTKNNLSKVVIKGFDNGTGAQVQNVVITAGSLYEAANNLEVKVTTLPGYKNFFRNLNATAAGQDQIGLKATLYYNNQPLAADNISYYWCIKDANATANDSLPFIESGWKCLNGYTTADVIGTDENETVQVWKSSNTMILDEFDGSFKNDLNQIIHSGELKNENDEVVQAGVYKNVFDQNYSNTVACFVKYNGVVTKSNEIDIINYNLHNFEVSLNLTNGGNKDEVQKIIYENDVIPMFCQITAKQDDVELPLPKATFYYKWKVIADSTDITDLIDGIYEATSDKTPQENVQYYEAIVDGETIIGYTEYNGNTFEPDKKYYIYTKLSEILNCYKLNIKDAYTIDTEGSIQRDDLNHTITIELPEKIGEIVISDSLIKVSAEISIKVDAVDNAIILNTNDEIQIESHTHEIEQMHSVFSYKYYLSESMNVTFEKNAKTDGVWSGDWDIEDPTKENEEWEDISSKDEWDVDKLVYTQNGWTELNKLTPSSILEDSVDKSKKYYLYYTKQEDVFKYIGKEKEVKSLDSRPWQYPLVLNVFTWNGQNSYWEKMFSISVDQINTFNQFTQGGKENGIFYQEESYILTKDTEYTEGKNYYTVSFDSNGKPNYSPFNDKVFAEGESYYEKTNDENRLYINATYINTGTLRVGSANNEKFFASINEENVRIAGWNVNDHSLTKGTVGLNSDENKNEGIAFWAGNEKPKDANFYVTHDGHVQAKTITIGGDSKIENDVITNSGIATTGALQDSIKQSKDYVDNINQTLQDQIDGVIIHWVRDEGVPTPFTVFNENGEIESDKTISEKNYPANNEDEEWGTDDSKHVGDTCLVNSTGAYYRWTSSNNNYYWVQISDTVLTDALNLANSKNSIYWIKSTDDLPTPNAGFTLKNGDLCAVGGLYIQTLDTEPQSGTVYYTLVDDKYQQFTGDAFEIGIVYYTEEISKLYMYLNSNWELISDASAEEKRNQLYYEDLMDSLNETKKDLLFEVKHWPSEEDPEIPYIVLKAKNDYNAGLIFFNTDELVINSDELKLNYKTFMDENGEKKGEYTNGYFELKVPGIYITSNNGTGHSEIQANTITSVAADTTGTITGPGDSILISYKTEYTYSDSSSVYPTEKTFIWKEKVSDFSENEREAYLWERESKLYGNGFLDQQYTCLTIAANFGLTSDYQYFKIDKNGIISPNTINFKAISPFGDVGQFNWYIGAALKETGDGYFTLNAPAKINGAYPTNSQTIKVVDTLSGRSDEITIAVLSESEEGFSLLLSNESHTIACDSTGAIKTGESLPSCEVSIFKGTTKLKYLEDFNFSLGFSNDKFKAEVKNDNDKVWFEVTQASDDHCEITVTATVKNNNDEEIKLTKVMKISKSYDGTDGINVITCYIESFNGTSFPENVSDSQTTTLTAHLYQGANEMGSDYIYEWFTYDPKTGYTYKLEEELSYPSTDIGKKKKTVTVKIKDVLGKHIFFEADDGEDSENSSILNVARLGLMILNIG